MSNTIYTQILPVISEDKNKFNYVYQITELSTGLRYIGSKGTKLKDAYKSLKKYQSSSTNKCFKISQQLNPLNYHYEILSYHKTRKEATNEEARLHKLYDVKCNPRYINDVNQTENGWCTAGKVVVKDKDGAHYFVNCDDPRYLSGELLSINTGKVVVKDKDGKTYSVDIDDPRYLSGELVHLFTGKVVVKDKDGNTFQVDIDDHRFSNGELVSCTKGKVVVKDKDGKIFHCNIDDPRYLSGELVSCATGKAVVKDKDGNTFRVDIDDPRYLSGELVSINTGKVTVKDKDGNMFQVDIDDPRYLSGELVHNMVGVKLAEDHKRNISLGNMGEKNGFYGRTQSEYCKNAVSNQYKIDGINYRGRSVIAEKYGVSIKTVSYRCNSDKWPDWKLVKKRPK